MSVMPSLYLSENVLSVITEMINDQNCRCIDKDSVPAYSDGSISAEKVMVLEIVVPLEPPLNVTLKDLSEIASVADRKHWDVHFYEREKAR